MTRDLLIGDRTEMGRDDQRHLDVVASVADCLHGDATEAGEMTALDEEMARQRAAMVEEVRRNMRAVARQTGKPDLSPRVAAALGSVPRHLFVPPEHLGEAYANRPLPIGQRQTISQPFVVALMTELLDIAPTDTVLEVGTGSGYQTAILAKLAARVFSIESVAVLAERAKETLANLSLGGIITTHVGDGRRGLPGEAPFDAILVTAAPDVIPDALVAQLKPGGRLVAPVGSARGQQLILVEKKADQSTILREILAVCFVPLTRPDAASKEPG